MPARIRPLILCGGSGTRLWPVSRDSLPKQFIELPSGYSPFQETIRRVQDRLAYDIPIVVASETHRYVLQRQLDDLGAEALVLLEPDRRDSGPAVLAGCMAAAADGTEGAVAILASDHLIGDEDAFHASLRAANEAAARGFIVAFGMRPTAPATGFGYIKPGGEIAQGVQAVASFEEKPDAATAASYVSQGYLWNSGNFLTRPETLLMEYAGLHPSSFEAVSRSFASARRAKDAMVLDASAYAQSHRLSIDYAIMEKTALAAVVPSDWRWSDIGTWQAMWEIGRHDPAGNVWNGDVESIDSHGCFVRSPKQLVSMIGTSDLIVVVEEDAILVADRNRSAEVKTLVEGLARKGSPQASSPSRVHRPWGWYEVRDIGQDFQVKRIGVYPGGRLSLQRHRYRAEHWVVVTGTARVTVDDTVRTLTSNQHAEIPLGSLHRLENPGDKLLEIVEVQHGSYLGEDDIIRIEDIYDRVQLHAAE